MLTERDQVLINFSLKVLSCANEKKNRHKTMVVLLQQIRKSKRLNQDATAAELGFKLSRYKRIERGIASPTIEELKAVSKWSQVPLINLLDSEIDAESLKDYVRKRFGVKVY